MYERTPEIRQKISDGLRRYYADLENRRKVRGDQPGYGAKHARVYTDRGRPGAFLCEGGCGSAAKDWAMIHGRDGTDPAKDYVPLCRSCHRRYDARPQTLESRQKKRDATQKSWADPEVRERRLAGIQKALASGTAAAKIGAKSRAAWADPEYREKQRISRKLVWARRKAGQTEA